MPNILADPNLWEDAQGNTPPAYWNGNAYFVPGTHTTPAPSQYLEYVGSAADMPVSMTFNVVTGPNLYELPTMLAVTIEGPELPEEYLEFPLQENSTQSITIQTAGANLLYFDFLSGSWNFTYSMDIEIVPVSAVDPSSACEELGRATRAFVSGYDRTRTHEARLVRGEKRCLVANFNGAIPKGRTIAQAVWRTTQNWAAILSNGRIFENDRSTAVDMLAGWGGPAWVKVEATLDNGEVYTQVFRICVQNGPWFSGEANPQSGPQELIVIAN